MSGSSSSKQNRDEIDHSLPERGQPRGAVPTGFGAFDQANSAVVRVPRVAEISSSKVLTPFGVLSYPVSSFVTQLHIVELAENGKQVSSAIGYADPGRKR